MPKGKTTDKVGTGADPTPVIVDEVLAAETLRVAQLYRQMLTENPANKSLLLRPLYSEIEALVVMDRVLRK
jgi:hypothetical protein